MWRQRTNPFFELQLVLATVFGPGCGEMAVPCSGGIIGYAAHAGTLSGARDGRPALAHPGPGRREARGATASQRKDGLSGPYTC